MDCFYAAVEVKYRPELKGKPLGVGGPPNTRSVLTTASYEARKFGVRSAMPSSQAVRLCPDLILVPPNFSLYKKESQAVREIMKDFTDKIEPLSLDEAYLDVTHSPHCDGIATKIAKEIRARIEKELGLTASAGIAPNKFLAKIASDWKKPNGQFTIRPEDIEKFMPPLKVEKIFGVGKVTAKKMHDLGLFTCGDIQKRPLHELQRHFGSRAQDLRDLSFGIDERAVDTSTERKSLTVEETYNADLPTVEEWQKKIPELYRDWDERQRRYKGAAKIKGIVVKVRFHDFQSMTREKAFQEWPKIEDFRQLVNKIWEARPEPIRLLGLGVRMAADNSDAPSDQLKLWD
jgi:DNA polymerase-4